MINLPALSPKASQALLLTARLGCLTQSHLRGFLFAGSSVQPASQRVLVCRLVRTLTAHKLLTRQARLVGGPSGGSTYGFYQLTPAGMRLVRALDETLPTHPPSDQRRSISHALAIADTVLLFHRSAAEHPGHELSSWETEWQIARRLGPSPVVPDIHLVYATDKTEIEIVIEVDLATERPRYFNEKIGRYLDLLQAATWRKAFETWPIVLTVAPTEARAAVLATTTERYLTRRADWGRLAPVTEFAFSSLPQLEDVGVLGKAWQVVGRDGLRRLE